MERAGGRIGFDTVRAVVTLRRAAGPFFVCAGTMHFIVPRSYRRIVPPYVPAPGAMVWASGVAEIIGGAGLIPRRTRRVAGWWLVATLVAVFPANVHMALHPATFSKVAGGAPALWARLPFQAVFIAWVLDAMRTPDGR